MPIPLLKLGEIKMFRVYYINHDYFAAQEFDTLTHAVAYGKSKCFDFSVYNGDTLVASWSVFGGVRFH